MFIRTLILICVIAAALVIFPACATKTNVAPEMQSKLDRNWGRSYESAKYNQMLNPEAGKTPNPVTGVDGEAAEKTVQKYRKSFEKEAPQRSQSMTLGIIGGSDQKNQK
jgi:type IV pilus biogenesis protein CpaD/CtpE